MADQRQSGTEHANEALQDMVSDPALDVTENDDEDHPFETNSPILSSLREISALATWTVSTHKPLCGAPALLHPTPTTFWQSDGPQPHLLTAYFPRTISILKLRIYLDFGLDESYTPTKIEFWGGVHGGEYGLVMFGEWRGEEPRGWVEVEGLEDQGGRGGGVRLRVLQVRVCENHQNGKDTHVRGVQVFARDDRGKRGGVDATAVAEGAVERGEGGVLESGGRGKKEVEGMAGIGDEPGWMEEPTIR